MKPEEYFYCVDGSYARNIHDIVKKDFKPSDAANWLRDVFHFEPKGLRNASLKQAKEVLKKMCFEVIIIGSGIAGVSAAIYASRMRMNYLLVSEDLGGQMNISGDVENYPVIKKTTAREMIEKLQEQMKYNNIKPLYEKVVSVKKGEDSFLVRTLTDLFEAKSIILCTGARPRHLGVPGEDKFRGKGVSYCAVCDGPFFKNKVVAVVGGGDAALESAEHLSRIAKKIYLITKNAEMKGYEYLKEAVLKKPNVEVVVNALTKEITGDKVVKSLNCKVNGKSKLLAVDGVFVEIGRVPNTELVKDLVQLDEHGHIVVDKFMNSSVPGFFAAGDCIDAHGYQYVTSAGQAVTALLQVVKFLTKNRS